MQRVFVYGSLKRGFWNHEWLTSPIQKFLGEAVTIDPFHMADVGFPYIFQPDDNIEFNNRPLPVMGEVYEVDDNVVRGLDYLEGVPHHYSREERAVRLTGEHEPLMVNIYITGAGNREYGSLDWLEPVVVDQVEQYQWPQKIG